MPIILIIKTEDGNTIEVPVLNKTTLGRSSSSDYKINDGKMSGVHCAVEVNNKGQVILTDHESTNGSYLNNSKISQTVVKINDIIRVGNTLIKINEQQLNSKERLAIGISTHGGASDKTLPGHEEKPVDAKAPKRNTVLLNKSIKEKKKGPDAFSTNDTVIDQEETGHTKFLKLEKPGKKK